LGTSNKPSVHWDLEDNPRFIDTANIYGAF